MGAIEFRKAGLGGENVAMNGLIAMPKYVTKRMNIEPILRARLMYAISKETQ